MFKNKNSKNKTQQENNVPQNNYGNQNAPFDPNQTYNTNNEQPFDPSQHVSVNNKGLNVVQPTWKHGDSTPFNNNLNKKKRK